MNSKNNNTFKNTKNNSHKYILFELYAVRGSIKHYFHFFFGVLVPLVLEYIEYKKQYEYVTFIIKNDVGPFFRVLFELPIDIKLKEYIHVDDNLIEKKYLIPQNTHVMNEKSLQWIKKKYAAIFTNVNRIIFNNWIKEQINNYNFFTYSPNNANNYDIVIIERRTNPTYVSGYKVDKYKAEIFKLSGSERRCILNHSEFVENIKKVYPNKKVINISTEYMPLFQQYYIFSNTKLVIAQHGASLSNIIFMKNKASVIEIINQERLKENWFLDLSKECDELNYNQYLTNDESVVINLDDFNNFMSKLNIFI